jgi:hypothetical protein
MPSPSWVRVGPATKTLARCLFKKSTWAVCGAEIGVAGFICAMNNEVHVLKSLKLIVGAIREGPRRLRA